MAFTPKKISAMAAAAALVGTEMIPGVQGGANVRLTPQMVAEYLAAARPNLLINGDFAVNQRAFAGGALAAGVYGFDRWKADASGANLSLAGYVATLTSGTIVQVVELAAFNLPSQASQKVTVSVEAPSADLTVNVGSVSGNITAGAGRRSLTLTLGAGDVGDLTVKITKATAGVVTFGRVKVEVGPDATPWVARPDPVEMNLCFRYFWRSAGSGYILFVADSTTTAMSQLIQFPAVMRAVPTLTFSNPHNGSAAISLLIGAFQPGSTINAAGTSASCNPYCTVTGGATMVAASSYLGQGTINADAEL